MGEDLTAINLEIGQPAPIFSLSDDKGQIVDLSDYKGKKIILYFYPKDNTPGCTLEANAFNDALGTLQEHGYAVLGISRDSVKKHANFKEKFGLQFPLLADTEEVACQLYGVLKEKKNYGKTYIGIERSTFVMNEEGIITHIYRGVKVKDHVQDLLKELV